MAHLTRNTSRRIPNVIESDDISYPSRSAFLNKGFHVGWMASTLVSMGKNDDVLKGVERNRETDIAHEPISPTALADRNSGRCIASAEPLANISSRKGERVSRKNVARRGRHKCVIQKD